jgi:hypothetical protein
MGTRRSRNYSLNITRHHSHRQRWWATRSKKRSKVGRQFRRPRAYLRIAGRTIADMQSYQCMMSSGFLSDIFPHSCSTRLTSALSFVSCSLYITSSLALYDAQPDCSVIIARDVISIDMNFITAPYPKPGVQPPSDSSACLVVRTFRRA